MNGLLSSVKTSPNSLITMCVELLGSLLTIRYWKGQFFPLLYSWCSAFGPNAYSRINQPKPTCIWTGWRLQVTQKTILNTQCINHSCQGEGDPKRRVQWYSLLNPELMLLLDPSPIPDPCLTAVLEKEAPDDICGAPLYCAWSSGWCTLMMQESHHQMSYITMNLQCGRLVAGNWAHSQTTGTRVPHYEIWKFRSPGYRTAGSTWHSPPGSPARPRDKYNS